MRTAESVIQEFARKIRDPLSRQAGSGNETIVERDGSFFIRVTHLLFNQSVVIGAVNSNVSHTSM